ncbi:MAG: hypothetical protein HYX99_00260 [Chloroflexi bacterium]|nr:hypothetical protein [Chloroflexota bacterium]
MLLHEFISLSTPFQVNGQTKQVTYITRVDPITGNLAKISEERARRQIAISTDLSIQPTATCAFCDYQRQTPGPRIEHACGAVSVPNLYPWEKYDWVTIYPPFGEHKLLLSDLYFDDLERMVESSYDLALHCSRDPEVLTFLDFTNWGPFAGASQQHPHSQRKSATWAMPNRQEQELQRCLALWERHGRNPFDMLAEEERSDGSRVIYDNDVFIAANFAPSCSNEVVFYPKEPVSHILQTTPEQRRRILRSALGIFPALFFYMGVTNLNVATHMAPFRTAEAARHYYRWHMHVYPRRSRLPMDQAGAEIGFGTQVIDILPETTARVLRLWYQQGPQEEMLARSQDGQPHPDLAKEFRRFHRVPVPVR